MIQPKKVTKRMFQSSFDNFFICLTCNSDVGMELVLESSIISCMKRSPRSASSADLAYNDMKSSRNIIKILLQVTHIIEAMQELNFSIAERYHCDAHIKQGSKMICIACLKLSCTKSVGVADSRACSADEIAERSSDRFRKQLVRRGARTHKVEINQMIVFVVLGHCSDV
jgi:hypothetical protein